MALTKILSLDGGGAKGIFQAHFLNLLEKRLNKPVREMFDYIGGTSIGGINALLLTHPLKWFGYRDDTFIQEMFDSEMNKFVFEMFFSPPPYLVSSFGLLDAKYSYQMEAIDKGLKDIIFGEEAFGMNIKPRCMIFAHNAANNQIKAFKSWKHNDYYTYTLARATSAAPLFFPPVCIDGDVFIDAVLGGAKTPAPFILYEAKLYRPKDEYLILSLGTGIPNHTFQCEETSKGSLREWGLRLGGVIMSSPDRAFEYLCGKHDFEGEDYYDKDHYLKDQNGICSYYRSGANHTFRFRPNIRGKLDDIGPKLMGQAKDIAYQMFEEDYEEINQLVEMLG